MQTEQKGRVLAVKNGRIVCPFCRTKLLQMLCCDTEARRLPLYCRQCKNTTVVNISGGVCTVARPRPVSYSDTMTGAAQ